MVDKQQKTINTSLLFVCAHQHRKSVSALAPVQVVQEQRKQEGENKRVGLPGDLLGQQLVRHGLGEEVRAAVDLPGLGVVEVRKARLLLAVAVEFAVELQDRVFCHLVVRLHEHLFRHVPVVVCRERERGERGIKAERERESIAGEQGRCSTGPSQLKV